MRRDRADRPGAGQGEDERPSDPEHEQARHEEEHLLGASQQADRGEPDGREHEAGSDQPALALRSALRPVRVASSGVQTIAGSRTAPASTALSPSPFCRNSTT